MIPSCDQTGTPLHFHSSTTSGSACLINARIWPSTRPRQSPSSLILASISRDAELLSSDPLFFMAAPHTEASQSPSRSSLRAKRSNPAFHARRQDRALRRALPDLLLAAADIGLELLGDRRI